MNAHWDAPSGGGSPWQGGFRRCLFESTTSVGPLAAAGIFVALILADGFLLHGTARAVNAVLLHGDMRDVHDATKAGIASLLPVALAMAFICWQLAKIGGGRPWQVLSLRSSGLGFAGSALIVLVFVLGLYVLLVSFIMATGIDVAQYTPGPHGEPPSTGSAGEVKEAMFDFAGNQSLFLLILPSVAIGAPVAEELIFRGQIFTALARSPAGFTGATLLTSLAWALMHFTEPWLAIAQIFVMGLVLGYLLYRFGSLWLTMLCHGAWNLVFALVIYGLNGR